MEGTTQGAVDVENIAAQLLQFLNLQ